MVALTYVPSDLYGHVYRFLVDNQLAKTAIRMKKEVDKELVVPEGPCLVEICSHYWNSSALTSPQPSIEILETVPSSKKKKSKRKNDEADAETVVAAKKKKICLGDEVARSETEVNTCEQPVPETSSVVPKKKKKSKKSKDAADPSTVPPPADDAYSTNTEATSTEASATTIDESSRNVQNFLDQIAMFAKKKKSKSKKKSKGSAAEEGDSTVTADAEVTVVAAAETEDATEPEAADAATEAVEPEKERLELAEVANGEDGEDVEDDDEEQAKNASEISKPNKKNSTGNQPKNAPFRRVVEEEIFVPAALQDNSFNAKKGASGDWGEKASRDLIVTKGKSFRHEKTKKKRGSYRGGDINTSVNSIKFDNSDDE